MSIDLIVEVLDHAPPNLSSGERLVLLIIAERANDKTRVARQSKTWTVDTIAARAGMKRSGVRAALHRLAEKGCEVRMPVKHDSRGEPVYAFEGTATTFKIPHLRERGGHSNTSQPQEVRPQQRRGATVATERCDARSIQSLKEPSLDPQKEKPSSPLPPPHPEPAALPPPDPGGTEEIPPNSEPQQPDPAAAALVDGLPAVNGQPIRPRDRPQLAEQVAAKLTAGWTPTALHAALTDKLGTAKGPGVYLYRLREQIPDIPPAPPPRADVDELREHQAALRAQFDARAQAAVDLAARAARGELAALRARLPQGGRRPERVALLAVGERAAS